jgi:hypothetical protein
VNVGRLLAIIHAVVVNWDWCELFVKTITVVTFRISSISSARGWEAAATSMMLASQNTTAVVSMKVSFRSRTEMNAELLEIVSCVVHASWCFTEQNPLDIGHSQHSLRCCSVIHALKKNVIHGLSYFDTDAR